MNPIANVDSTAVSNLEGKEYIRFVWNEISSNQINSNYTLSESILRTIYSHHCVDRNLRKAALLALADGLNYGKVIAYCGEDHNKSQKTGMIGVPIMIDGVKYLLCVTTMRNRNHVIKPYAITLKDANGNNVEEKTVVGNNLVNNSNNGNSTFGNNSISTITASQHTNTPLSSNAKVQQYIQSNKQNNENKQYNNMNKNRIRLTESQLHSVIKESVKKVLNEMGRMKTPSYMHLFHQYGGVRGAARLYIISNGKNTELRQALIEYGNDLKLDDLDPKHIAKYLIANYPKVGM